MLVESSARSYGKRKGKRGMKQIIGSAVQPVGGKLRVLTWWVSLASALVLVAPVDNAWAQKGKPGGGGGGDTSTNPATAYVSA
jgi:hypothetical protein